MGNPTGSFIWYELMTTDAAAASAFYDAVVGWTIAPEPDPLAPGMDYRMIMRDVGRAAGGVLTLTPEMTAGGARPCWLGYIYVADVDDEVEKVLESGGATMMPATTMPGIGRMAMVTDPFGAAYYLMTPQPPEGSGEDQTSDVFTVDQPQTVRWNELVTPDDIAAVAYYTEHYGWTQEGAMPMGELGDYRFIQCDGVAIGAVMKKAEFMPVSGWSFYVGVDDIDRAVTAAKDNGGKVLGDPMEIPGGEFSVQLFDPQGAYFGLVGPRRQEGGNG